MRYVYVVCEKERWFRLIDLNDKTVTDFLEYKDGGFDFSAAYTWNKQEERDFLEYATIEEIFSTINIEDIVFINELHPNEVYKQLDKIEYSNWKTNWESCFALISKLQKSSQRVGPKKLKEMMQQ